MPQYRYRALDKTGREVEGSIDAGDANAAVQRLSSQGLQIKSIEEGVQVVQRPKPPQQPPVQLPPDDPILKQPQQRVHIQQPIDPAATVQLRQRRTKPSTDSDLYFVFAQLSNLLNSGISPAESAAMLSQRNQDAKFVGPLRHIASMTAEGTALSTAMAHYPDLFPAGIVGGVRAGEKGGYLPEACEVISKQRDEAKKLKTLFKWPLMIGAASVFCLGLVVAAGKGISSGIDSFDTDPSGSGSAVWEGMLRAIFGPVGIVLAVLVAGYFIFRARWMQYENTLKRHDVGIKVPLFGLRAKNECLAIFSWNLGRLAKAGLSPFASWQVAADAVPNVAYADDLRKAGQGMSENTKFSELFYQSSLFPHEVAATIETGEMTGSIETALEQAMQVARDRQIESDRLLKFKSGCWIALLMFAGPALGIAIFYHYYFSSLFRILD
ncbi:MAG: type II secretion system F family protein [Armatimonadetes bacterium]|nr:type II secretion system F family protein [Armatimonadota bacterium]